MSRKQTEREHECVVLDDLHLAPRWRAWLLARADEGGSLAAALRSVVNEAALADIFRSQYEDEQELRRRLLDAGRTHAEVRKLVIRWRKGERIKGISVAPPAAARILHPGVFSRVPQIRAHSTRQKRTR